MKKIYGLLIVAIVFLSAQAIYGAANENINNSNTSEATGQISSQEENYKQAFNAVKAGKIASVRYFIEDECINPEELHGGLSMFHVAVLCKRYFIAEYLIKDRHINIEHVAQGNVTALMLAIRQHDIHMIRFLLLNGATITHCAYILAEQTGGDANGIKKLFDQAKKRTI